jgi:hypothetical protein
MVSSDEHVQLRPHYDTLAKRPPVGDTSSHVACPVPGLAIQHLGVQLTLQLQVSRTS